MGGGFSGVFSILASTLLMLGFMTFVVGFLADTVAANRKILEDVQYHARRADYATCGKDEEAEKPKE